MSECIQLAREIKDNKCWCCGAILEAIIAKGEEKSYGTNEIVELVSPKDISKKRLMSRKTAYHHIVDHLLADGILIDSDEYLLNSMFEFQILYSRIYRNQSEKGKEYIKTLIHKLRIKRKRALTLAKPAIPLKIKTLAS